MKNHFSFSFVLCLLLSSIAIQAQVQPLPEVPPTQPAIPAQPAAPAIQPTAPAAKPSGKGDITVQFPNAPVRDVLDAYQNLTGKRIIRDPSIEQATVTIETPGMLTKPEAVDFIEKSLLIAGYAIVPSGENMVKVIAFASRKPSSEGVPLITKAESLPQTDQVVSFILPLEHLKSEDAAQAFQKIIPLHTGYGDITPVPNSRALVITENSNTIRAIIEMTKPLDVPPAETAHRTYQLERASVDEVIEALNLLLGISGGSSSSGTKRAPSAQRPPGTPAPVNPQQVAAQAAAQISYSGAGESDAAQLKLQAIQRTNSILAIARPVDLVYIEKLIKELDAPSTTKGFISHTLKYLEVADFLNVAKDALERNADHVDKVAAVGNNGQTTSNTRPVSSQDGNSFGGGNNYGGRSGFGGGRSGGGGAGGGGTISLQEQQPLKPLSIRVGSSLLIAEPSRNELFASGPPEHLRIISQLIEQLDKRPQQIQLSLIIGEFSLTDDFRFGLDWVRTLESVNLGGTKSILGGALKTNTGEGSAAREIATLGGVKDFLPALQGLTVYGQIGQHLNTFLTALENTNRFHVMQRPAVVTLNHKLATISTGTDLAIPGTSYPTNNGINNGGNNNSNFVSNTEYVPVRISLGVIPHIFNDHEVKLELQQINSDVASYATINGNQVPNISTQQLQNTIIVPNQTTVLLGGLITERDRNNKSGLPWLVRIPLVKYLFGSTSKNKERRELLIFVQPHILSTPSSNVEAQMDITSRTQSYEETRKFYREGPAPNPLLPLPVQDSPYPPAQNQPANLDMPPSGLPNVQLRSTRKGS